MKKIFIVGNPNTGKSTLFNSLTKSDEHTGNWHGVTVKEKSKIVNIDGEQIEFFDLPGIYSLNTYTFEEEVSLSLIQQNRDANILYVMDANNIKRNLYLLLQLLTLDINLKVLINNYDYFEKNGGKINLEKLKSFLDCDIEIINAKKIKLNKKFLKFKKNNKKEKNNLNINEIYKEIDLICENTIKYNENKVYGKSKLDKYIFNPYIFVPVFIILIFFALFLIFFLIGPILNNFCSILLDILIKQPVLHFLNSINCAGWIVRIFDEAIFSSLVTICSFLPQVCMLYIFLSMLEQSGLISRMAFMLDDYFSKIGLNGKCVYTMLMSFGCNTSATFTSKNMADKNSHIKSALVSPFMSCSAKLPIYMVVATAFFGLKNIFVIFGLYLLGIAVGIMLAFIYEKTILKSNKDDFFIEFPPLRQPNINDILKSSLKTSKEFIGKVFGIIFSMSVVIWILSNVGFNFRFSDYDSSILYTISEKIAWIFKPLGLNSPYIVCALIIGLVAKELIVSSMLIFNKVSTTSALISSLTLTSSAISFNVASSLSFLVFVLLYSPCISSISVLYKEIGKKFATLGVVVEFLTAYLISMLVYNIASGNLIGGLISLLFVSIIVFSFVFVYKKIKKPSGCSSCVNCGKCNL